MSAALAHEKQRTSQLRYVIFPLIILMLESGMTHAHSLMIVPRGLLSSRHRSEVLALSAQSGRHIAALKAYGESDRAYRSHGGTEPRSLTRF